MRERTTWSRSAAQSKTADPYLMNQDHVSQQPKADQYVNGDPSKWKEDPSTDNRWEAEYSNGQVKRDEIGMGEMRSDTFNHPEKTASAEYLTKKATLCLRVAAKMLGKKASSMAIEEQSVALMDLGDADLIDTFNRLAGEDDSSQQDQGQKQAQQDQAQQGQEEQKQAQAQQQAPMAQQQQQAQQQVELAMQQAMQAMQQGNQQAADQAMQQAVEAEAKCHAGDAQQQLVQASKAVSFKFAAFMLRKANGMQQQQAPMAQQQQQAPMAQQQQAPMAQQQQQAPMAQQQQAPMAQQQQAPMAQQQQQAPMAQGQEQQAPMADDALMNEILLEGDPSMADTDIELDQAEMGLDMTDMPMDQGDDMLNMIFASNPEVIEAKKANGEDPSQQQQDQGQKQGSVKTASRIQKPVQKLGGAPVGGGSSDNLSNLWASAPDVSKIFGLEKPRTRPLR